VSLNRCKGHRAHFVIVRPSNKAHGTLGHVAMIGITRILDRVLVVSRFGADVSGERGAPASRCAAFPVKSIGILRIAATSSRAAARAPVPHLIDPRRDTRYSRPHRRMVRTRMTNKEPYMLCISLHRWTLRTAAACLLFPIVACDDSTKTMAPTSCAAGMVDCGGICVELASNPDHCGSCSIDCNSTEVCSLGNCSVECHPGLEQCGRACVSTRANNENCGTCGNVCEPGTACSDGMCMTSCREGLSECSIGCVSLVTDYFNCGACGNVCNASGVCSLGHCSVSCHPGLEVCNGACVDYLSNHEHCGGCGHACGPAQVCSIGECALDCREDLERCGASCLDTAGDFLNCGGCGQSCAVGEICAFGTCVSSYPEGWASCDEQVVNLMVDLHHCGHCQNACSTAELCVRGMCESSYPADYANCDGEMVNLTTDNRHCGDCAVSCDVGAVCELGACSTGCSAELYACDGRCVDLRHDPHHCGDCDTNCELGSDAHGTPVCLQEVSGEGPTCGVVYDAGFYDCDGDVTNGCEYDGNRFATDNDNCGACGIWCNTTPYDLSEGGPFEPAEECIAGHCWGDPPGRRSCKDMDGHLMAMPGCKHAGGYVRSACCEWSDQCSSADMVPILVCECPGVDVCLGHSPGEYYWGDYGCWDPANLLIAECGPS